MNPYSDSDVSFVANFFRESTATGSQLPKDSPTRFFFLKERRTWQTIIYGTTLQKKAKIYFFFHRITKDITQLRF